jgi:hypothetical protein
MIAIGIYSCRKDFMETPEIAPEVNWAKDYFTKSLLPKEGNLVDVRAYVKNSARASLMSSEKENMKVPIWQKAKSDKTNLYEFVEVALKYTTKVTPMLYLQKKGQEPEKTTDENVVKASFDRLIIYKNKKGAIDQRIISFVPSLAYLERHNGDISHNSINKLDKDFEGMLVYRKWDGSFLFALMLKNGKAFKKIALDASRIKFQKAAYRVEVCENYDLYECFVDCEYEGDNPVPVSCGAPYQQFVCVVEVCHEEEDPDPCLDPANFNTVECGGNGGETGGGGIGGDPEENCNNTMSSITGEEVSENVSSSVLETMATTRKKEYQWKYLESLLWFYVSTEEGVHKKVGTEWQWDTLTHKRVYREGTVIGGTLTMTINSDTPTIGIYNAGMRLNYDFKGEAVCKGSPLEYTRNNVTQYSPLWNVDDF